jgi:hypothetical protein
MPGKTRLSVGATHKCVRPNVGMAKVLRQGIWQVSDADQPFEWQLCGMGEWQQLAASKASIPDSCSLIYSQY